MFKLAKLLSLMLITFVMLASTQVVSSSVDVKDLESLGFKVSVFSIDDWNFTVIWFGREPDLVIEYCGKNLIYYKPYLTLKVREITGSEFGDPEVLVMIKISKYVGLRNVNRSDLISVAMENERRHRIALTFNEVFFEKANGKALGLKGINLRPFFEWEPPAIGLIIYLGSKSFEEKENTVRKLLQNPHVVSLLKSYNVSYVIVHEADSMASIEESSRFAKIVGDLLTYAYWDKISAPESIKGIIKAQMTVGGTGPFGSVAISINATTPDVTIIRELVKWIRDNVKHCDIPIVITFNDIISGMEKILLPLITTPQEVEEPGSGTKSEAGNTGNQESTVQGTSGNSIRPVQTPTQTISITTIPSQRILQTRSTDLTIITPILAVIIILALVAYTIHRSRTHY